VSLWEIMQQFNASELYEMLQFMSRWESIAKDRIEEGAGEETIVHQAQEEVFQSEFQKWLGACRELNLNQSAKRLTGPTANQLFLYGLPTWHTLSAELRGIRELIQSELGERYFVFISDDRAKVLDKAGIAFQQWREIGKHVSAAEHDIEDAQHCYAIGCDTACVFHLMRVAEHGLRRVFRVSGARLPTDKNRRVQIEYASWNTVIDRVREKISKVRKRAPGARRERRLQFFSEMADRCEYMKDLWRNEASHARRRYNQHEAMGVMNRVREFMLLTIRPTPK